MDPSHEPGPSDDIALNDRYRVLSHPERRRVLEFLDEHESVTLPDLAEYVACCKYETRLRDIPDDDVLAVYISLWHVHIPKMEEAGMLVYDQESDIVATSREEPPRVGLPRE